jgi:hypothetical protein
MKVKSFLGLIPFCGGRGRNNGNKNCDSGKSRIDYYPANKDPRPQN